MDSKILYHNSFAGHRPTGNLPVARRASPSLSGILTIWASIESYIYNSIWISLVYLAFRLAFLQ